MQESGACSSHEKGARVYEATLNFLTLAETKALFLWHSAGQEQG